MSPTNFIVDVDGVLTTGQFHYSSEGKIFKIFGKDDSDGLSLLKNFIKIIFISGDKKGFEISKKRVQDMGFEINLVSTIQRVKWIQENFDFNKVIYMGDGIFDHYVFKKVFYSIAPYNAHKFAKENSNFITSTSGGNGAVAEACLHILEKFFEPYDPNSELNKYIKSSGDWQI